MAKNGRNGESKDTEAPEKKEPSDVAPEERATVVSRVFGGLLGSAAAAKRKRREELEEAMKE